MITAEDRERHSADIEHATLQRRRAALYACYDGMCGADDCPRCRPSMWPVANNTHRRTVKVPRRGIDNDA